MRLLQGKEGLPRLRLQLGPTGLTPKEELIFQWQLMLLQHPVRRCVPEMKFKANGKGGHEHDDEVG